MKQALKVVKKKEKEGYTSNLYDDGFMDARGWIKNLIDIVFDENIGDIKEFIDKVNKKPFMKRLKKNQKIAQIRELKEANMAEVSDFQTFKKGMKEKDFTPTKPKKLLQGLEKIKKKLDKELSYWNTSKYTARKKKNKYMFKYSERKIKEIQQKRAKYGFE